MAVPSSLSFAGQSWAFTTLLATRIPCVPSFSAAATSSPETMPAPQSRLPLYPAFASASAVPVRSSGLA
jgi:hypothetical protein